MIKTIEFMISKKLVFRMIKEKLPELEIIGSWKFHYLSWKTGVPIMPKILVKYEDLLDDIQNQFCKIISFLSKILNFETE